MMPPPLMGAYLKENLELLKKAATNNQVTIQKVNSSVSLNTQILEWIECLTQEQKNRMYGISEIIQLAGIKGKFKDLPAKQMVATALYKCGFIQRRSWVKKSRNRRLWFLPPK